MHRLLIILGLARTVLGQDYRSRGQRRQLSRMGRELLSEAYELLGGKTNET